MGINNFGQVGDGTNTDRTAAVDVVGLASGVSMVSGGIYHSCAVLSSGTAKCWGGNLAGALGDGTTTHRNVPGDVAVSSVKPTSTSTPCPPAGCPAATATPNPPQTGIDFSIKIDTDDDGDTDCDSGAEPAKCVISIGDTFTLTVMLNSLPPNSGGYQALDIYVTYAGATSANNASSLVWPDCVFTAQIFFLSGLRWGCTTGTLAPPSFYVGPVGTNDFTCGQSGTITLVHGPTDTALDGIHNEPNGTSESLTINCVAATATPTNTPQPPSLGGVAEYPNASSGSAPGLWTALAAATVLVALAGAVARRRLIAPTRR
jgi:hypothetical protein